MTKFIADIQAGFKPFDWKKALFLVSVVLSLSLWISPAIALLLGLVVAQTIGNPIQKINSKVSSLLLEVSAVGLGGGINVRSAVEAGKDGAVVTIASMT